MKRTLLVAVSVLIWGMRMAAAGDTRRIDQRVLPTNLWFHVGEVLTYRIYWGIIPVGTATITTDWADLDGRKLIAIRYRALSNKVISTVYPVDSTIESLIDPATFKSVRFTKNLREGRHRSHEITTFDYGALMASWTSLTKGKSKTFALEPETRDLVAFLYAVRACPFEPNDTWSGRVMADDSIYDLWIRVREREAVKLPGFGKVTSVKIEPEAAFNGIFVRKGKITVWVSDDERRLVTRIVGSVPVADIDVVLCDVRGPGSDFWVTARAADGAERVEPPDGSSPRKKGALPRRR